MYTTANVKSTPGFPRDMLWAKGQDQSSNASTGAWLTSKTYLNYWRSLPVSGENFFWLGNWNKQVMDDYLAALPFASKAFNTFSGVTDRRERLVPGTSIHTAGSGQDGFWQNSHTLPEQLHCKAEGVPVAHPFPSFVPYTLVHLLPLPRGTTHSSIAFFFFFLLYFFHNGEKKMVAVVAVPEYYSIRP